MKLKWRGDIWKKSFLIAIGILMFIACSYAENIVKSDGGNPLLQNLRVTRTWAPTGNCITTLDAKWIEPTAMAEARALTTTSQLTVAVIHWDVTGWNKKTARVYGAADADHAVTLWMTSEPIRDLIDLAIPAEEVLALEWWDTYSQYRILFTDETAADIAKLSSYIIAMRIESARVKSSEWTDGKDKGGTFVSDNSRSYHVGKGSGDVIGPHPILKPSCGWEVGGKESLGPNWIAYPEFPAYPEGWAYPSVPGGPRPSEKECLEALTELVDNLAQIANKHGLQVSDGQKKALFDRFAETEYLYLSHVGKGNTTRVGPDPRLLRFTERGYSDRSGWWPVSYDTKGWWPKAKPRPMLWLESYVKTGT